MKPAVRIVEVALRDGLQNEKAFVPTSAKTRFIKSLVASGLSELEVTSFVSPTRVPQLADAEQLCAELPSGAAFSAFVPNSFGAERALATGLTRLAFFTAVSDTFCRKNVNKGRRESMEALQTLVANCRAHLGAQGWLRCYISTAFECPFEGRMWPEQTESMVAEVLQFGVDEVSLGDTIGVSSPAEVRELARRLSGLGSNERIAFHFHDTRGTAVANVAAALDQGFCAFDSSAAGLGGCPFAPGASGNLATEDLVYFLEREGVQTGVNGELLARSSLEVLTCLGRQPTAKAQVATLAQTDGATDSCASPLLQSQAQQ